MKRLAILLCASFASPAPAQHGDHGGHGQPPETGVPEEPSRHHAVTEPPHPSPARGALGAYPMAREVSGTDWQPDSSIHGGVHLRAGEWTLMGHLSLNLVYDRQGGRRGDEMGFVSGMAMGSARRELGNGTLQLRAALSPDPLMGRRGYPLHLAAGESADGATPLLDRQHPHDLFVELSASYSHHLAGRAGLFVYAGLPGAPAFGPPAFMHRMSIQDSPEAPITHHWLDSTHIAFGVVTAGLVVGNVKFEGSRFNGREPDERRYNIETGPLDSTAFRLGWNPTPNLSLQASWARLIAPEQLDPQENSTRWSASAIYTQRFGTANWWSATLAWGNRDGAEAFGLEAAVGLDPWTIYGRAEYAQNDELAGGHHGPRNDVGKLSAGVVRDFRVSPNLRLGIGAQYALNFVPAALEPLYGGDPDGAMAFIRLRLD